MFNDTFNRRRYFSFRVIPSNFEQFRGFLGAPLLLVHTCNLYPEACVHTCIVICVHTYIHMLCTHVHTYIPTHVIIAYISARYITLEEYCYYLGTIDGDKKLQLLIKKNFINSSILKMYSSTTYYIYIHM